jgi:hypothetical protein
MATIDLYFAIPINFSLYLFGIIYAQLCLF